MNKIRSPALLHCGKQYFKLWHLNLGVDYYKSCLQPTYQNWRKMSSEAKAHGYQNVGKATGLQADVTVDFRSDTLTKPSAGMRQAIANALVGDDIFGEDPTTNEFEARMARLFEKEAALLVCSGTQGNLISALVHCSARGSELIVGDNAHMFKYEQGNLSQFGGIHSAQIPNLPDGTFSLEALEGLIRPLGDVHYPISQLVCVENTHNRCGGRILPLDWLDDLAKLCQKHQIPIHMDGARIFNASVASGVPVSRIARDMASVSICLSKGLGSPAGSVIVGSRPFIEQARRMRKALGGGMRQNGIISAAGLYILDNMVDRLAEDHQNAREIAKIVNQSKKVRINMEKLETNILVLELLEPGSSILTFVEKLAAVENEAEERAACEGKTVSVKCFPWAQTAARLVTHCDVNLEMARLAAHKIVYAASKM